MRDVDVRAQLHRLIDDEFAHDPSTVVVDELGIRQGQVRIDVAAVNGDFYGFEIKAANDTLDRLEGQVAAYREVLDFAAIVVAEKHHRKCRPLVPRWWGIYVAREVASAVMIDIERPVRRNPKVDRRALVELLWHSDALALLSARGAARGLLGRPRRFAWDRLCEIYTLDEIRDVVRQRLKQRRGPKSARSSA